jgi:ribosomal protein S18 acetylase RimI-like enzyme
MSASVTIRRAGGKDVEALTQLCGELGYPADRAAMAGRFEALAGSPNDVLLVAEKDGTVIGYIQAHKAWVLASGFRVEIAGLVVAADARRTGAGRALVAAAEDWAREVGAVSVVVRSNVKRVESHLFYPALGYTKKKTQEAYAKALGPVASSAPPAGDPATKLVPMTQAEHAVFSEDSTRGYADEKVASGEWSQEDALRLAKESHASLLPQGFATPGHYFYNVREAATDENVGVLWFGTKNRSGIRVAYVYAIYINHGHRRKGHASRAFAALEAEVRNLGLSGIELHVFAHNPLAHGLYKRLGYRETNVFMFKELGGEGR